jgi:excisionase family DNA binding protein
MKEPDAVIRIELVVRVQTTPSPPVPASSSNGDWLTVEELAELMHTSPGTVHYWRHQGKAPPALKAGRRLLFRRDDVDAWMQNNNGG